LPIGGDTRQVRVRHDRAQLQESPRRSSASRRGIRMRRIRPHPLESRALSSWGSAVRNRSRRNQLDACQQAQSHARLLKIS